MRLASSWANHLSKTAFNISAICGGNSYPNHRTTSYAHQISMRYISHPQRWLQSSINNENVGKDWNTRNQMFYNCDYKWCSSIDETFSQSLNIKLAYSIVFLLLAICSKETKLHINTSTWASMFIASSFIIANKWKQHKCPSTDEYIKSYTGTSFHHKRKQGVNLC